MTNTQKIFIEELDKLFQTFENADLPTDKIEILIQFVKNQELLIPVVGEFSAGKSTLLNSFIGGEKPILPTSVAPETAIATELRYGTEERIEAVGKNGDILKVYETNDFETINKHADEYSYLKLYLKNENLKNIEPLVLVDMPGFESPLDAHNTAIQKYLNKGSYFIVLVSATDGTLKATSIRHLNDVLEYERDFSVVLSKSNLVEPSNLESVLEKVKDDIDINFCLDKEPVPIDMDGSLAVKKIVTSLNPDKLFMNIIAPTAKDILYQLESTLNMKIAAFNKDTSANDEIIEQLKTSVDKIKKQEEKLLSSEKSDIVNQHVLAIVSRIDNDLSNAADNLAEIGARYGNDRMQSQIQDLIHSSLITNVKEAVKSITNTITSKFSIELETLNSELNAYCGEIDFIENLTTNTELLYNNKNNYIDDPDKGKAAGDVVYKTLTSILAITTDILSPLVELLIVYLPDLVKNFFNKKQEEIQKEQIKLNIHNNVLSTVIPDIKNKLLSEVPHILEKNVNTIIEDISEHYSLIIEEKQKEIAKAEEERQQKADEIKEIQEKLSNAKNEVSKISEKLFF